MTMGLLKTEMTVQSRSLRLSKSLADLITHDSFEHDSVMQEALQRPTL